MNRCRSNVCISRQALPNLCRTFVAPNSAVHVKSTPSETSILIIIIGFSWLYTTYLIIIINSNIIVTYWSFAKNGHSIRCCTYLVMTTKFVKGPSNQSRNQSLQSSEVACSQALYISAWQRPASRLPLRRLAEALGNTSESRALIGCFSSANYYSNFEPYLVIQISNIV
jgi:hypothetical protein